jgi:ElaB/YqjD/DUF883 family membrane-anchored ribosome-binding protein
MDERLNVTATTEPHPPSNENIMREIKMMFQRAEEKAIERAKVADKVIRDHPYPTIGIAFVLGLLLGVVVRRR